jgi:hypothetical protein
MTNETAPALPSSTSSTSTTSQTSVKKNSKISKKKSEIEIEGNKIIEIEKNQFLDSENIKENLDLGFYSPSSQSDTMRQLESLGFKVCI